MGCRAIPSAHRPKPTAARSEARAALRSEDRLGKGRPSALQDSYKGLAGPLASARKMDGNGSQPARKLPDASP
jgi:hypothetical protein